jgi:uncharacterized protein
MPQTVLITGASSGIGRELARLFARDGSTLILTGRSQERLAALAEELTKLHGRPVRVFPCDLGQPGATAQLVDWLAEQALAVDVLVNNAGTQVYGEFAEADSAQTLEMIQVNITALVQLTCLLLPGMLQRKHGKILNLGSTGSFAPGPFNAVYCATKAFVLSFSEAIAAELAGSGVSVTALCPGATDTAFVSRHGMQNVRLFRHMMRPADVAAEGYRALLRGSRMVVTGGSNRWQVLSFQLMKPLMGLVSNRMLKQIGERYMGRD